METVELKLKQASAVLRIPPKELQNFVQLGVVRPRRRQALMVFDANVLCQARVAMYLKEALGSSTRSLSKFVRAFAERAPGFLSEKPDFIVFKSRPATGAMAVEIRVPFRKVVEDLEQRLTRVNLYKDLPKGRKRPGWKAEFIAALKEAAQDLGPVTEAEILETIRGYGKEKQRPEITVVAEAQPPTS